MLVSSVLQRRGEALGLQEQSAKGITLVHVQTLQQLFLPVLQDQCSAFMQGAALRRMDDCLEAAVSGRLKA
jgi:hypothetical protein